MADITDDLNAITNDIYGDDVIDAIIEAVETLNNLNVQTMDEFRQWLVNVTPLLNTIDVMKSANSVYDKIQEDIDGKIDDDISEKVDESIADVIEEHLTETIINDIKDAIMLRTYPVGSIYISADSTDPHDLFGGTWISLGGRFLIGAGSNIANNDNTHGYMADGALNMIAGKRGGEPNHKLSVAELASHNHTQAAHNHNTSSGSSYGFVVTNGNISREPAGSSGGTNLTINGTTTKNTSTASVTPGINNTGGNGAHNNMPPYLVVYMWQRTAL